MDEFLVIPDQQDGVHDVALSEEQVIRIAAQLGLDLAQFMKAYEDGTIAVERFMDTSSTPHQIVVTFSDEEKAVPVRFKPHLTS